MHQLTISNSQTTFTVVILVKYYEIRKNQSADDSHAAIYFDKNVNNLPSMNYKVKS